jgi:hypothetical protein
MKTYCGSAGIVPRILDLGTKWRCAVSFTPRPPYPLGKSPEVSIEKEAEWAPEPVWTQWGREKVPSLHLPGIEP